MNPATALSHDVWVETIIEARQRAETPLARELANLALDLLEAGAKDPGIQEYLNKRASRVLTRRAA